MWFSKKFLLASLNSTILFFLVRFIFDRKKATSSIRQKNLLLKISFADSNKHDQNEEDERKKRQ